jgi:hypothetical protein
MARGGVEALNRNVHRALLEREFTGSYLGAEGPVWTRSQLHAAQRGDCRSLNQALKELSDVEVRFGRQPVRRMVVGHTIQPSGFMQSYCDGALWAIDICVSQYMMGCGFLGHLEIHRPVNATTTFVVTSYPPRPHRRHQARPAARATVKFFGAGGVVGGFLPLRSSLASPAGSRPPLDAIVLGIVAAMVVAWRIAYNWQRRHDPGVNKKTDAGPNQHV